MEIKLENEKIIRKWGPIIESLGIKNDYLIHMICIFCEKYSTREKYYYKTNGSNGMGPINTNNLSGTGDTLSNLPEKLKNIVHKLNKMDKIEIKKSFYNPFTGLIEHELENGLILDENMHIKDMDEKKFIHIFGEIGLEILRESDPTTFRDKRLNEILNEKEL